MNQSVGGESIDDTVSLHTDASLGKQKLSFLTLQLGTLLRFRILFVDEHPLQFSFFFHPTRMLHTFC